MFLAWFDATRRRGAHLKLADAIDAYREKFGDEPAVCLTNQVDAEEIASAKQRPPLPVKAEPFIPRHTFYVGQYDGEPGQELARPAA